MTTACMLNAVDRTALALGGEMHEVYARWHNLLSCPLCGLTLDDAPHMYAKECRTGHVWTKEQAFRGDLAMPKYVRLSDGRLAKNDG